MGSLDNLKTGKKNILIKAATTYLTDVLVPEIEELMSYYDLVNSEILDRQNILMEVRERIEKSQAFELALRKELKLWG